VATTPLDVIKTRLMTQGSKRTYTNVFDCASKIAQQEGYATFLQVWSLVLPISGLCYPFSVSQSPRIKLVGWQAFCMVVGSQPYGYARQNVVYTYIPGMTLQSEMSCQSRQTRDSVCFVHKKVMLSSEPIWQVSAFMNCFTALCHKPALLHTLSSHNSAAVLNVIVSNVVCSA